MLATSELLTPEDEAAIAGALAALETAKAGDRAAVIKTAIEELDAASKAFAQRRMNRALERGLRGHALDEVEAKIESKTDESRGAGGERPPLGHDHG